MSPQPQQYCTFFLEGHFFGVEVQRVQEVIRYQRMARVPLAPPVVRGLINLRGQIVIAFDLRYRLGFTAASAGHEPLNVVVRSDGGPVSLLVDEIGDVVDVSDLTFQRPPKALRGAARDLIRGVYTLQESLLLVLDVERTLALGMAESN